MHRSRLTAVGIDVPAEAQAATADFWAGALGRRAKPDEDGTILSLGPDIAGLEVFVQRVGEGGPRFHVDIETDDVEAEVLRLEELGATRVEQVSTWWIMRDPAGNLLCVVPPQSKDFPADAATWP